MQSLTLAWAGADGTFAQENQVSIPLEADGKYHDYQIDLAGQPGWSGQVSRLRFITEAGGVLEIDSIPAVRAVSGAVPVAERGFYQGSVPT